LKDDAMNADELIARAEVVINFLCGEGELDGVESHREAHPSRRGAFWWRSDLREAVNGLSAALRDADSEAAALRAEVVRLTLALDALNGAMGETVANFNAAKAGAVSEGALVTYWMDRYANRADAHDADVARLTEERDAAKAGAVRVKPGLIEREIWKAMIWASKEPPPHGSAHPPYKDSGNSFAETECRQRAASIRAFITKNLGDLAALKLTQVELDLDDDAPADQPTYDDVDLHLTTADGTPIEISIDDAAQLNGIWKFKDRLEERILITLPDTPD
jgi:hypothetical protein